MNLGGSPIKRLRDQRYLLSRLNSKNDEMENKFLYKFLLLEKYEATELSSYLFLVFCVLWPHFFSNLKEFVAGRSTSVLSGDETLTWKRPAIGTYTRTGRREAINLPKIDGQVLVLTECASTGWIHRFSLPACGLTHISVRHKFLNWMANSVLLFQSLCMCKELRLRIQNWWPFSTFLFFLLIYGLISYFWQANKLKRNKEMKRNLYEVLRYAPTFWSTAQRHTKKRWIKGKWRPRHKLLFLSLFSCWATKDRERKRW